MPFDSSSSSDYLPPRRRNTRSLDLDDSAKKAAAWVWHLHDDKPGITTDGRFISTTHSQRRKSSSSSYDCKSTRFRLEAAAAAKLTASGEPKLAEQPALWDCGSKLYDTFELVSFSNKLDWSFMETPALHDSHHGIFISAAGVERTMSVPSSLSRQVSPENSATAGIEPWASPKGIELSQSTTTQSCNYANLAEKVARKWASIGKALKLIKEKVLMSKQVDLLGCKSAIDATDPNNKPVVVQHITKIKAGELDRYMRSKDEISQVKNNQEAWKGTPVCTVKQQVSEPKLKNHEHLHHHIHHHHHVQHNLASESARLSAETCMFRERLVALGALY